MKNNMKTAKQTFAILLAFVAMLPAVAQRQVRTINSAWAFTQEGRETIVNIPHTWNALDIQDDEPGYYRGLCTYRKTLHVNDDISETKRMSWFLCKCFV